MKTILKFSLIVLSLSFLTSSSYVSWLDSTTVKIIAVHQEENFSEVIVKNFPITDAGKIKWWLKNKELLKNKYNIPRPGENGNFYINFWDFGEGYKKPGKYDRRCFPDMKPPKNCIDKLRFSLSKMIEMVRYYLRFIMGHIAWKERGN